MSPPTTLTYLTNAIPAPSCGARRLIDEVGCDLVHTHLLRADLFGGAAARWAGVPVIVSTVYAIGQYRREETAQDGSAP